MDYFKHVNRSERHVWSNRKTTHAQVSMRLNSLRVFAAVMFCGFALAAFGRHSFAQIPAEIEFQRDLLGRIDSSRATAMKSIRPIASDRRIALPIVAQSLIELAEDDQFEHLQRTGQSDLPEGVQLMFQFVGASDHQAATKTLLPILQCSRFSWRLAAVEQLCRTGRDAAVLPVIALIDSPDFQASYGFRFSLARGLTRFRHPRAWFALAGLYQKVDGQLAHRMHRAFTKVTVADFRGDRQSLQRWRQMVGLADSGDERTFDPQRSSKGSGRRGRDGRRQPPGNSDDVASASIHLEPSASASSYQTERVRLKPSKYYGIDVFARRMLFVIDCSGSMKERSGETTRLTKAKQELIDAIRGLDQRCEFSILVFRRHVGTWKDQLVTATDENKREAIEFVSKLQAASETNTYDALRDSLAFDNQLEAIFVLTDGEPTCGAKTKQSDILADILQRNQARNITINTVALAVDPRMQQFLQQLTLPSEGEFRIVN